MAFTTPITIEKICRTCLSEDTNMRSVFSADESKGEMLPLYEMLMSCASVTIMEEDGLPTQVCVQCTQNIIRSYSFKQLCEKSDSTLRQISLQPKKVHKEEIFDHITDSYMEQKPYLQGSSEIEISNHTSYEYLEPKIESVDIDMQTMDTLDSEVASVAVKLEISKEETKIKIYEDDTNQITYPCKECSQYFSSAIDLKVHTRAHPKKITKHTCKVCHQDFASASTISRHMKVHDGVKRHLCNECGKSFSRSDGFKKHLRVHTGEKPYPCKICSKSFADSSTLVEHTRAHANKRAFVCSVCNKAFSRYACFSEHKKTHTGVKTHKCTTCGKRLCSPESLAVHKRIHTG